jgi:hypothetical protein
LGGSSGQIHHFDKKSDPDPHQSEASNPDPHQSETSDPNQDSDLRQSEKPDPDRTKLNADSQDWLRPTENSHMVTCAMSHQELGWLLGKFSLLLFMKRSMAAQLNRTGQKAVA